MNSLTNAARHLTRTIILAAFVALLAASTAQRAGANQSGDPVNKATSQAQTCEAAGGTAEVDVWRTVDGVHRASVTCKGGVLDGITCDNWSTGRTYCYESLVRPHDPFAVAPTGGVETEPEPTVPTTEVADEVVAPTGGIEVEPELPVLTANVAAHVVAPTGGVEVVEDEPLRTQESTDDIVAPTEGAEEPAAEEQVAASQDYDPTVGAGIQISMCEAAGGTAEVEVYRTVDGVKQVNVTCKGGGLDGWTCQHFALSSYCNDPKSRPEEPPTTEVVDEAVEPTGGVETEPEPTVPTTEVTDEVVAPTGGIEVVEDAPAVDEGTDDGIEAEDGGQDLPDNPAQDETTAPAEGDPVADPGAGAGGEEVNEAHIVAGQYGGIYFFEEDDEQA